MLSSTTIAAILGYVNSLGPRYMRRVRRATITSTIIVLGTDVGEQWIITEPEKGLFLPIKRRLELKPSKGFILNLKRKVEGSRILEMNQPHLERIVHFHLSKGGKEMHLYLELFGGGNIVLTDCKDKILACMKTLRVRHRTIAPGKTYKLPPRRGLMIRELDVEELYKSSSTSEKGFAAFLVSHLSLGGEVIEEALVRHSIALETPSNMIDTQTSKSILDEIDGIVSKILMGVVEPTLLQKNGTPTTLLPFRPSAAGEVKTLDTILEAGDELFFKGILPKKIGDARIAHRAPLEKKLKLISKLETQRLELMQRSSEVRSSAESLYLKTELLTEMFSDLLSATKSKEAKLLGKKYDELTVTDVNLKNKTVAFQDPRYTYRLDFSSPPISSIGKLYERAKRIERGLGNLEERIKRLKEEATMETDTKAKAIEEDVLILEPRKRRWYEKFKWTFSSDGFLIIAGRDAATNEALIKRYSLPEDIVFHADIYASPFIILRTNSEFPSDEAISEAAIFTASHSGGWKLKVAAVDVYWVKPSQLSKKAPSGEYLKRGSFMVYGKRNYIKNVRLELAVGIFSHDKQYTLMVGPFSTVNRHCQGSVVIRPGRDRKLEASKRIVNILLKQVGKERVSPSFTNYMARELLKYLPTGGLEVIGAN